jgi:hypothetical protein
MPKKARPPDLPEPSPAQRERAAVLRELIEEIGSGQRPPDAPAPTPREITDEAARRKWERESRKIESARARKKR